MNACVHDIVDRQLGPQHAQCSFFLFVTVPTDLENNEPVLTVCVGTFLHGLMMVLGFLCGLLANNFGGSFASGMSFCPIFVSFVFDFLCGLRGDPRN